MQKIKKYFVLHIFFFLITAILVSPGLTFEKVGAEKLETTTRKGRSASNLGSWLVSLFKDHISHVDGDRCPSIPTCSAYSVEAIQKHGFIIGWMMTVDRLIHEGSEEAKISPLVVSGGKWKLYDPVKNNDFWWFPQEGADSP